MKTKVILQARMGSTRYPGKAVEDICGWSMIDIVLRRIEVACGSAQILAIPDTSENDVLAEAAVARSWEVFRGSEPDVLERYTLAAREFGVDAVLRATADNPFIDPGCITRVSSALEEHLCVRPEGYPFGTAVEGIRYEALEAANNESESSYEREHVMPFFYSRPERFACHQVFAPWSGVGQVRLTVDTAEDIARTRKIVEALGIDPSTEEILKFLQVSLAENAELSGRDGE